MSFRCQISVQDGSTHTVNPSGLYWPPLVWFLAGVMFIVTAEEYYVGNVIITWETTSLGLILKSEDGFLLCSILLPSLCADIELPQH